MDENGFIFDLLCEQLNNPCSKAPNRLRQAWGDERKDTTAARAFRKSGFKPWFAYFRAFSKRDSRHYEGQKTVKDAIDALDKLGEQKLQELADKVLKQPAHQSTQTLIDKFASTSSMNARNRFYSNDPLASGVPEAMDAVRSGFYSTDSHTSEERQLFQVTEPPPRSRSPPPPSYSHHALASDQPTIPNPESSSTSEMVTFLHNGMAATPLNDQQVLLNLPSQSSANETSTTSAGNQHPFAADHAHNEPFSDRLCLVFPEDLCVSISKTNGRAAVWMAITDHKNTISLGIDSHKTQYIAAKLYKQHLEQENGQWQMILPFGVRACVRKLIGAQSKDVEELLGGHLHRAIDNSLARQDERARAIGAFRCVELQIGESCFDRSYLVVLVQLEEWFMIRNALFS
ncbi:hypothetical protein PMIN03_010573 [Paraphaeosphaeria minitans]